MKKEITNVSHMLPCSVVLLSAGNENKRDAMTATCMAVSENPPLFVVSVDKGHLTHALIEETGEFVINVASAGQVKLAKEIGFTHGEKLNKFEMFSIETEHSDKVSAPLIKGSFAHIECTVITSFPVSTNTVYLVNAVNFKMNSDLTPLVWHLNRFFSLKEEAK